MGQSGDESAGRRIGRRGFLHAAVATTAAGAAFYALGCGSGSNKSATPPASGAQPTSVPSVAGGATANPAGLKPTLLTTEFVANQDNRFAVGLLNAQAQLVKDAKVHLRFFEIGADGKTGTLRGEGDATYVELDLPGAHAHDKSAGAAASSDTTSFYLANTPFDAAGKWGVEITAAPNDGRASSQVQVPFDVRDKSQSPGLGVVPPASRNDTFATNSNTASLCSRDPACPLHDKVIADVLGKGRPLVVQFSTPAFCQTRFCGPVLEVLLKHVPDYQDRVDFVHIEVWQDFQLHQYRPAVQEWNLPGEPYTFFMGKDGKVAGKLEAIFSEQELTGALDNLVKL